MQAREIESWLRESRPQALHELWEAADRIRRERVGEAVYLRGLVEISSHCRRSCLYCGLRRENSGPVRYRMGEAEILACAGKARALGLGTLVLQSGEDSFYSAKRVAALVGRIKTETGLALTLSLGERETSEYALWRDSGADRYLLRFETSNCGLFECLHPPLRPGRPVSRPDLLRSLRDLGYEIGSGVMVGLPGQTYADLARDILTFRELELDMIGLGPYIPHPATPLAACAGAGVGEQVPATELMTLKMVALARLACPDSNIPATSALATLDRESGRELALARGANVVMPNLTPARYRALYEIYPGKACVGEPAEEYIAGLTGRIEAMGRHVDGGRGDSPAYRKRNGNEKEMAVRWK